MNSRRRLNHPYPHHAGSLVQALVISMLLITAWSPPGESATDAGAKSNPMVHRVGRQLVDPHGRYIKLRGVHLLGWLYWDGTLWNVGFNSETTIVRRLGSILTRGDLERFRSAMNRSFFTEKDVERIAQMGFNVIRVSFNHTTLEQNGRPSPANAQGWKRLDDAVRWCKKHDVFLIFVLHSAPGGQARAFTADPENVLLWQDSSNLNRTVELWRAIARRYKGEKTVAAYELLNEPVPRTDAQLVMLYKRIISAIRQEDPHHLLIIDGADYATDFSMFSEPLDQNLAYGFHTYNILGADRSRRRLDAIVRQGKQQGIPIINTEFGANTAAWTRETLNLFERHDNSVSGWVFWPWKRVPSNWPDRYRALTYITPPRSFDVVASIIKHPLRRKASKDEILGALLEFAEAAEIGNTHIDNEMARILTMPLNTNKRPRLH